MEGQKEEIVTTKIITRNEVIKMQLEKLHDTLNQIQFYNTIEEELDAVCADEPLDKEKTRNTELIEIKLKDPNAEINITNRYSRC